jgi:hypothetical protein
MRLKLCVVTLLCATLVACATPAPPRIVDSSCTAFRPISYAQMPKRDDGTRETDDQGNKADSDETVEEIDVHNAKWDRLCAQPSR